MNHLQNMSTKLTKAASQMHFAWIQVFFYKSEIKTALLTNYLLSLIMDVTTNYSQNQQTYSISFFLFLLKTLRLEQTFIQSNSKLQDSKKVHLHIFLWLLTDELAHKSHKSKPLRHYAFSTLHNLMPWLKTFCSN